jgi:hypothetical protein
MPHLHHHHSEESRLLLPSVFARRKAAELNVVTREADVAQNVIVQGKQHPARAPHISRRA